MSALSGDLSQLDLPSDLEILRDQAGAAASRGEALDPLYAALAAEHPMALMDLVMGPRALSGEVAVGAALRVAPQLLEHAKPAAVFRRLAQLGDPATVLQAAFALDPDADWLEVLAARLPGGLVHLARLQILQGGLPAALAARALHETPEGLVEGLSDALDDRAEPFFKSLVARLRSREAAEALRDQLDAFPAAQALVSLVLPGMV